MVFASLRFDDAIHVKPSELIMKDEGLFGVAWQTKVERKRAGTRFMVPMVGFRRNDWLQQGWDLFCATDRDRDYWMHELNTRSTFLERHPTYSRTVQWLKWFSHQVTALDPSLSEDSKADLLNQLKDLTAHSCRVTLLDAAVHARRSTEEIGLQANWKNPGPLVLKYTRNRSSVPATMVKQLVQELVQESHPAVEDGNTVLVDSIETDLVANDFFIKQPAKGSSYDYKYHATAQGDDSVMACSKFLISECVSVGRLLPDLSVLCKACAKARPDLVSYFSK